MNKPLNYVCSSVSDSHKTVYSLLSPELQALLSAKRGQKLHTVGRLDSLTEGLLLFTNDGTFSNELTRPESHVSKEYQVTLRNPVPLDLQKEYISKANKGLILPPEKKAPEQQSAPAQLQFLTENLCQVTISEGKFHQVRRMFQALENEVTALKRTRIGSLYLPPDLASGQWQFISKDDIL